MSSIIRASDRNAATETVAFNFDDLSNQARRYLDEVRAEAAKIVAEARRDAVAIRQQAEREGRQAALQAVERTVAGQLSGSLAAIGRAVDEVRQSKHAWLKHWERAAVHLAAAIARRVIRRELSRQPDIPLALVREALELATGSASLRIRMNPDDLEALGTQVETVAKQFAPLAATELVPDSAIVPGGCRIETRMGIIDQQFDAQLQRIEEELN